MAKRKHTPAYPAELRERGVWLFQENRADHASDNAAYKAIAPKLGCSPDRLRSWCQHAERGDGRREGLTTAEKDRIKDLEREVRELRTAHEILKTGEAIFRHWSEELPVRRHWSEPTGAGRAHILLPLSSPQAVTAAQWDGTRPPIPQMIAFIEDHRSVFRVGSICKRLPIAPSTFYARKAISGNPQRGSQRAKRDVIDRGKIPEAFDDSGKRYGARKIWHELRRSKHDIARCTVERLMQVMGLQGPSRQNCCAIRLPGNGCSW